MILGILSDTHDDARAAAAGIALLRQHGAAFFIHCGDVGEEPVLDCLAGLPCAVVWGNNDFDRVRLAAYAASIRVIVHDPYAQLNFDGKRILVTHGDDVALLRRATQQHWCDYLLLGHSHVAMDVMENGVRVINPGALHRARRKSVATLNPATGELKVLEVTGI